MSRLQAGVRFLCSILDSTAQFLREVNREAERKRKHRLLKEAVEKGVEQGGYRVYNTQGFDEVN